jgi:hypothetical protein
LTAARDALIAQIWRGSDPFAGFPCHLYAIDKQGWRSAHPYLTEAVDLLRPKIVVEIGVWKGASVITMARRMKELRLDGVVVAIDTWLGSVEHWRRDRYYPSLGLEMGRPQVQRVFMSNILSEQLQDYVLPLPLDSINASLLLRKKAVAIDLLHIDAGHDYDSVATDLKIWWPALRRGGVLIGDDYGTEQWPGVQRAFDEKFGRDLQHVDGKCWVTKSEVRRQTPLSSPRLVA